MDVRTCDEFLSLSLFSADLLKKVLGHPVANHSECGRFPPCRVTMDTTGCDHQRKQAELSRREQPHPTSRSRRTTATRHRGLFGSTLAMGVLSICTTENDPVKYNLNVGHCSPEII